MTAPPTRRPPVVLVLWQTPLLDDLVKDATGTMAKVIAAASQYVNVELLLRMADPAVVVVDTPEEATQILGSRYATNAPVIRVSLDEQELHVFRLDARDEAVGPASTDDLRCLLIGCLHASSEREAAARARTPKKR